MSLPTRRLAWRRSSASQGADQTCVDVAIADRMGLVRDSKDPNGPILAFTLREWLVFVEGVRAGEFDTPGPPPAQLPDPVGD